MGFRDQLQYASCSEDLQTEIEIMKLRPGAEVVAIAGGGGRALGLLGRGSPKVWAIDFNAVQLSIVEWKVAAMRCLSYSDFCVLMGLKGGFRERRRLLRIVQKMAPHLPKLSTRVNWRTLRFGMLLSGRVEEHFTFGGRLLNRLYPSHMQRLLVEKQSDQRLKIWDELGRKRLWNWLVRQGSSPWVYRLFLQNLGWYNQLPAGLNVPQFVLGRIRRHLERYSVLSSHVLQLVLYGKYFPEIGGELPHYLCESNYFEIKADLSRLHTQCAEVVSFFSGFRATGPVVVSISNVPAYLDQNQHREFWRAVANTLPKGSLVVGRHFLRKIPIPPEVSGDFVELREISERLSAADRSFIYDVFVYERQ